MAPTKRFSGKSVIITGSSNGIGRATAVLFAKQGAQVTITGRDEERLEAAKKQILKLTSKPNDLNVVVANLTDSKGLDDIVNSTLTKFGKIDILINNAGANISDGTLNTDQSIELYQKTFQINFQAVVEMIKKTKEHLIKTKGEIVNVSSIAGNEQAFSATPYYCAAKSALNQYTRCIALDLIQYGVRVNSVSPGVVVTGFLGAMGLPDEFRDKVTTSDDSLEPLNFQMANFMASNKACIPAGFCAKPNDIAEIILFLSDRKKSQYIVGQSIVADGGTSLVTGMTAFDMHEMI
ncbi:Protein CBG22606 [Caenorhabditis briggsae]|uniref:Protein CBG22606 n=1 Tax=Caenorhabditis briggsae TaxID=6238 RepID=A8Y2N4_CAEBR|nr:Protein CBG22606 [Caenorhabditis briggsae]CAP39159.1 Protein CBG22606 [Caenorhabditis briggsae]